MSSEAQLIGANLLERWGQAHVWYLPLPGSKDGFVIPSFIAKIRSISCDSQVFCGLFLHPF